MLPSNSPGVHSLWIPAVALKTPLVLKPGSAEPWTPYPNDPGVHQAGVPPEAFSFYPADHAGAGEILRQCGRGMVFGDVVHGRRSTQGDPRIEIHGPGYSKVLIGDGRVDDWEKYLDVIVASIADNSGRSCVNASGVWSPRQRREIAEALAERLASIAAARGRRPGRAARAVRRSACRRAHLALIDDGTGEPGAATSRRDTAARPRSSSVDGLHLPAADDRLLRSPDHPLANREFLFPFAAWSRCRARTWRDARAHRADPRGHRDHRRPGVLNARCSPRRTSTG